MRQFLVTTLLLIALLPGGAQAQQRREDPLRFLVWPLQDARGLVTGFSSREWIATAGAGATLLVFSRFDRKVTNRVAELTKDAPVGVIEEFGNVKVVRPIGAALLLGALMSGSDRFQDAAFTSIEAVLYANLVTNALKSAVGRSRPYEEDGPAAFSPFSGGTSFPSGHAATAFAFLTPWALYYPGPLSAGLLLIASATAMSRMATNFHWFSDVVGGSAVGFVTAYALVRRHTDSRGGPVLTPTFGPEGAGLQLRF